MSKFIHKHFGHFKRIGKADLHIHSRFSDGKPSIAEILQHVQEDTDLDVIAITDHDTIEGALLAKELAKELHYRFEVIIGEEISCHEGHILGLFLKETIPGNISAKEALQKIHEQGGVAIAAHPLYKTIFLNDRMVVMNGVGPVVLFRLHHLFDGIEIVNSTPTLADENITAAIMNRTLLFRSETGSSDAHILDAIGRAYTAFEGKTAEDLRRDLRNHQTQAIFAGWTALALIKYLFFFIPIGLRLLWFNIVKNHEYWLKVK